MEHDWSVFVGLAFLFDVPLGSMEKHRLRTSRNERANETQTFILPLSVIRMKCGDVSVSFSMA